MQQGLPFPSKKRNFSLQASVLFAKTAGLSQANGGPSGAMVTGNPHRAAQ